MTFRNIITFLFLNLFISCNSQTSSVKKLSPAEFEKRISDANVQLVDVRTPEEYTEKHLLRSQNINVNDKEFEANMKQLDKSKPLYVYCLSGARSQRAAEWAVKNGFKEAYNLDGGITAWMGDKRAVVTESGAPASSGMSFDDYLNHLKASPKVVLVDFNAVWCGPCKMIKPIVHSLTKKNEAKIELLEIDVDQNPAVASAMNIRGIPLLLLYKRGKEVWRNMGLIDETTLAEKIKQFAY
jgi:thioredoxin 1